MKSLALNSFLVILAIDALSGRLHAQPTFQNLDFESVVLVPVPGDPYNRVDFGSAVPGWTGFIGDQPLNLITHDNIFLGSPNIALLGTRWGSLEGAYSLVLQSGVGVNAADVSIAQFGLIPLGTESLIFETYDDRNGLTVELAGQIIPLTILEIDRGYRLYGADISDYAGQAVDLRFTNPSIRERPSNLFLDAITFSTMVVPEPSVLGLCGLGLLVLAAWQWRTRGR